MANFKGYELNKCSVRLHIVSYYVQGVPKKVNKFEKAKLGQKTNKINHQTVGKKKTQTINLPKSVAS